MASMVRKQREVSAGLRRLPFAQVITPDHGILLLTFNQPNYPLIDRICFHDNSKPLPQFVKLIITSV